MRDSSRLDKEVWTGKIIKQRIEMKGEQDMLKQLEKELKTTKIALAYKTTEIHQWMA
jgi:hypothetical protein